MTDSFYGSLARLAGQYQSVKAPLVSPSIITSANKEAIVPPGTRALTIGRGGRATKNTATSLADFTLPPSLAGQLNPQQFAKAQEVLARDVPGSADTTNPTYRVTYKATPFKIGDIIKGLESQAERDQLIPIPQPRDLAFVIDDDVAGLVRRHHAAYSVDYNDLAKRYGGLFNTTPSPNTQKQVLHSTQEVRMTNALGLNTLLIYMELAHWRKSKTLELYEDHFIEHPASTEFRKLFNFIGGVYTVGNAGASGQMQHQTEGATDSQMIDITTAGPFISYDYINGISNVEQASCNMVISRKPIKSGVTFDLGWDSGTSYPGSYRRSINFGPLGGEMGKYSDTIYPIQVEFDFWPDGDRLPRKYLNPVQGLHLFGSEAFKVGNVMFRNIGNIGSQPIHHFAGFGQTGHYIRPPLSLDGFPAERSTFKLSQRRPVQLLLNGNPQ